MANKRYLHHIQTKLAPIKPLFLLIATVLVLFLSLYSLRQNNITALRLKDKVLTVDQQNGDVEAALRELREYVYAHMNTDLASGPSAIRPPVQLKYRYERLLAAEKQRVSGQNEKIYSDAQKTCEQLFPKGLSGSGRIPCIQEYVAKRGLTEQPIQDALYKFDFVSPRWSPDLAGWSLVLFVLFLIVLITRLITGFWLKRRLSDHM